MIHGETNKMLVTSSFIERSKNAYDIRSSKLSKEDAFLIGKAFGSQMYHERRLKIVLGYDRRIYSKDIHDSFLNGLLESGIHVLSIGRVTTPMVQLAEFVMDADASVIVTASHNPIEDHGMKFFVNKHSFAGFEMAHMLNRVINKDFYQKKGSVQYSDFRKIYSKILSNAVKFRGKFKVGWDLSNASAGDIFPFINQNLKGLNIVMNHEYDPTFGGFAPDPTVQGRLSKIKHAIKDYGLDFAFAFDGDADRCILIDKNGSLIEGDKLLALYSFFEARQKKVKVVWDSKSSQSLIKWTKGFVDECIISQTGHSNIYNNMKKHSAKIAGECSGHYMFEDFFGINDGIYAAMRFLQHLEDYELTLPQAMSILPKVWTEEGRVLPCKENKKDQILSEVKKILTREGITIDANDGIKACYSDGWWLLRASRTEPILRVTFEGWNERGLENIKSRFSVLFETIEKLNYFVE
jgi:phosphomannomutase